MRLKKQANTINKEPWNYKDIKHEIEKELKLMLENE